MFRIFTSLILVAAASAVPAKLCATEKNSSHGSTPAKGSVVTSTKLSTTTPAKLDGDYKFAKLNTGYTPKVSATVQQEYSKKSFDHDYCKQHGTKFDHGWYYSGKNHFHWSYRCWDVHCGCYVYWCPCTCCYYYWCQPDSCFYPITYCPYQRYTWTTSYVVECVPVVACESVRPQ